MPPQNTTNIPYSIATRGTKICHLKTATAWIATSQDEVKKHYPCNWQSHDASSITVTSPPHLHTGTAESPAILGNTTFKLDPSPNVLITSPDQPHYTKSQKQTDTRILSSAFIQASAFLETSCFVTLLCQQPWLHVRISTGSVTSRVGLSPLCLILIHLRKHVKELSLNFAS